MISALIIFFETFALAWLLHWLFSRRVHIDIRIVSLGDPLRRARKRDAAGSTSPGPVSDLQSALENLGAKKKTAQAAAEKVCAQYPRASFETLLRLALQNTP